MDFNVRVCLTIQNTSKELCPKDLLFYEKGAEKILLMK